MKIYAVVLAFCLISTACLADTVPEQVLHDRAVEMFDLYKKHDYPSAAAILENLATNPEITAQPDWPGQLYNLACLQALEGERDKAIATLQQVADMGDVVPDQIAKDADLSSLHGDPRYEAILARLQQEEVFWGDTPAIATPYKPVLPDDEKVAGLSKFWSEAKYNFAFFDRMPSFDWDGLYMAYLPKVRAARTTADYYRVMMRFASELRDGHTDVEPPKELFDAFYARPAFRATLIEDKVLVTDIYDPALSQKGIAVGDEVLSIDGIKVRDYAQQRVAPQTGGFAPQDRTVRIYHYGLFAGPVAVPLHLVLKSADGQTHAVTVTRRSVNDGSLPARPHVRFEMLPGNIAYLAVNEFSDDQGAKTMQDNFAAIAAAKGLIIDVRENGGGSTSSGYAILQMLTEKPFLGSNFRTREYQAANRAWGVLPGWHRGYSDETSPDAAHFFKGPVAVLIGAQTYSAAEDFVVAFDEMNRGTLIGQTTGGGTGQPLVFKLPGGGGARIGAKDDSYADGKVFEGVGIAPKIAVAPTVADIRSGRDPVLEKARSVLLSDGAPH